MPYSSNERKFLKFYEDMVCADLCVEDDEGKIDEYLDNLVMVLCVAESSRYLMSFIRDSVPKSNHFLCVVLPNIDEKRFEKLLHVNWEGFNKILNLIRSDSLFDGARSGKQYPIETQLAVTLYRLGSSGEGATISKIASLFGIGNGGTTQLFANRVFEAIIKLKDRYVFWPSLLERQQLIDETAHELPHCFDYVDGSEVALAERPTEDPEAYYSRKQRYALKVQVVCDHKLRIRHLITGYPGSVHDARIYNESNLALRPENYFSGDEWIAGDSAYKLTQTILTPYRKNSAVVNSKRFNRKFSTYRVRIEHCLAA